MNKLLFFLFIFSCQLSHSQIIEGQNFCQETIDGSFVPLSIDKKKILWYETFYFEYITGSKIIKGKTYIEFKQEWENKNTSTFYLREKDGVIYQYDQCCENETIKYNHSFNEKQVWKSEDTIREYRILSYKGKLQTPFCKYENLLVIEAKMEYGTFNFYYLKGHGYVGATKDEKLVSCVTPKW